MTEKTPFDARIALLASRQSNSFSRAQALVVGGTDPKLQRRVNGGRWGNPYPGVYTIAGSPPTFLQALWCACLAVGPEAVVTHESALRMHGLDQLPMRPLTLTVPHGSHTRLDGVFVHQIDDLEPHCVTKLAGLPVSKLERVIVELAATRQQDELADIVDTVLNERRCDLAAIESCFYEVLRPGKPGMAKLATVLDSRGEGYIPPASVLEKALFTALAAGGLPEPARQALLPGRRASNERVDGIYESERVIIEADGRRWHAKIKQLQHDHERDTEAARAGYLTLRFMWEQINNHPEEVCAAVRDVLASRAHLALRR